MSEVFPSPVILNFFDPIVDLWLSKDRRSVHVKKTVEFIKKDSQKQYHEVIITIMDDGLLMTFKGDTRKYIGVSLNNESTATILAYSKLFSWIDKN